MLVVGVSWVSCRHSRTSMRQNGGGVQGGCELKERVVSRGVGWSVQMRKAFRIVAFVVPKWLSLAIGSGFGTTCSGVL